MKQGSRPGTTSEKLHYALDVAIGQREDSALELLRRLIRTPSVTGTEGAYDDPDTVSGLLRRALAAEEAIERHSQRVADGRDNIIAVVRGAPGDLFVLDAHTDTVPPGDAESWVGADPYAATDGVVSYLGDNKVRLTVRDRSVERPVRARLGRVWEARSFRETSIIYGRGAFDNKGPVAVAYLATVGLAAALARTSLRLRGTLVCGFTVDEEQEMAGVRAFAGGEGCWVDDAGLLPSIRDSDGHRRGVSGVALDGSYSFVPIVGHRGVAQLLILTHGQAAHAATPNLGVNAVTMMANVLHALATGADELVERLSPLFGDALLEPVTLALGTTIVGGGIERVDAGTGSRVIGRGGINVVPDWCEATIDCRHPRPADGDLETIRDRIASAVGDFARERTGLDDAELEVSVLGGSPPVAILAHQAGATDDPLVGPILRHGATVLGFQPWVETAPGGTDATVMVNEGGIRTLVEFGPAGALAHEPHEFVERDQIALGALILARTIVDVLGVEPAP